MPDTAPLKLPLRTLAKIHHVDHSLLGRWQREGIDVMDSREVAKRVLLSQLPVKAWQDTKAAIYTEDGESHEHFKREKTKQECQRLQLMNAKAAGEMVDRGDAEKIAEAWSSALKLALAERRATAPQALAGKDEAWIADFYDSQDHRLLTDLSNLESSLWNQVLASYGEAEEITP